MKIRHIVSLHRENNRVNTPGASVHSHSTRLLQGQGRSTESSRMQLTSIWSHRGMEGRDLSLLKQPLWGSINLSVAGITTSMCLVGINTSTSLPSGSSFFHLKGSSSVQISEDLSSPWCLKFSMHIGCSCISTRIVADRFTVGFCFQQSYKSLQEQELNPR